MSLTSDDLADIKQLMTALLSAQEKRIDRKIDSLAHRFDEQDEKLDEILNALGGELNSHEEQITNHERRIYRLEQKAA